MSGVPAEAVEIAAYGPVARLLHWLVALLAVAVVALGLAIPAAPRESSGRDLILLLHRSVALSILATRSSNGCCRRPEMLRDERT